MASYTPILVDVVLACNCGKTVLQAWTGGASTGSSCSSTSSSSSCSTTSSHSTHVVIHSRGKRLNVVVGEEIEHIAEGIGGRVVAVQDMGEVEQDVTATARSERVARSP